MKTKPHEDPNCKCKACAEWGAQFSWPEPNGELSGWREMLTYLDDQWSEFYRRLGIQ